MEEILVLYYEINNIYLELFHLELEGKRDLQSFKELVELLRDKAIEERELFREFIHYDESVLESLSHLDEVVDNPFTKRIVDYINFDYVIDMEGLGGERKDDIQNKAAYAKLYSMCTRNIYLLYLSFLQEQIDGNFSLREKLLNFKYCSSFVNHDVEKSLILNNFWIDKNSYIDLYLFAKTLKLEEKEVNEIILRSFDDTVILSLRSLLSIDDYQYNTDEFRATSINVQCMLRAGLAIYDDKEFPLIEKKIEQIMRMFFCGNNRIGCEIIKDCLHMRSYDRCRVRKLSFDPLDN